MKNLLILVAVIGLAAVGLKKCSVSATNEVAFTGTWIHTSENGVAGTVETEQLEVATDGKNFRITQTSQDSGWDTSSEIIQVYYEGNLATKSTYKSSRGGNDFGSHEPRIERAPMSKQQAAGMKFWSTIEMASAQAGPGGLVAGRNTLLFQARDNRPDGTATMQRWIDAETKVLLKSSVSIYASQIESILTKETYECQKFQLGAPDPSVFKIQ